jgi:hypothetical protein
VIVSVHDAFIHCLLCVDRKPQRVPAFLPPGH